MVVDDDNTMVKLLEKQLGSAGHKIIGNLSGEGVMKRLELDTPDLFVLDLMFPETDGVQIAQQIRAREETKTTPIIFITSTLGVENDDGDEHLEVDGEKFPIFAKPLHVPKLLATVRKAINRAENS